MQYEYNKDGIGGWLGLLLATMALRIYTLGTDFLEALHLISIPGLPVSFPTVGGLQLLIVALTVWSIQMVIVRNPKFRKVFVITIGIQLLWAIMVYNMSITYKLSAADIAEAIRAITSTIIYGCIWIPYVYCSKRLKNRLDILDVVAEVVEEKHGIESRKEEA